MKTNIHIETLSRIAFLRMKGMSLPKIADQLNAENYRTVNGGQWYPSTVQMYCRVAAERLAGKPKSGDDVKTVAAVKDARRRRVRSLDEAPPRESRKTFTADPRLNRPVSKTLVKVIAA